MITYKNWLIAAAVFIVYIPCVFADTTSVFCANSDGSHWEWLEDEQGSQVEITGFWGASALPGLKYLRHFSASEIEYLKVNAQCQARYSSEYRAHPADNRFNGWYLFKVNKPNTTFYFSNGKYDIYTAKQLEANFQLRV
ncbi:hypothetical protein [Spartinivicinus poritis]|uniref:Uncharacterized protein n=1 Tax=Spartinivicinus poritis TaxID=2994640 RepID=A0ABT5U784_9GAMM|nr:hypothetical protein [Spartinivicinus sp. A2-2]MDE1461024.1 hypothetical protein [Spartinivicinus sp. A2-2]